jgi:hypothetical protein
MVDIQTISIGIASAGVFVAAIYYIFQIRSIDRLFLLLLLLQVLLQALCIMLFSLGIRAR